MIYPSITRKRVPGHLSFPCFNHVKETTSCNYFPQKQASHQNAPHIFSIYICATGIPIHLFVDFSLAGHLKNSHLLSMCPTNSFASQIIIDLYSFI